MRCESPSTFLGTCLSHHYFIIFLVTNTNTLLSGLYLISTAKEVLTNNLEVKECQCPLRLIPHFYIWKLSSISLSSRARCQCPLGLIPHFYTHGSFERISATVLCQCPLGLIPHFYSSLQQHGTAVAKGVSMPSRAYTSFLPKSTGGMTVELSVSMPSRAYTSFLRWDIDVPSCIPFRCQCPLGLIPHFY